VLFLGSSVDFIDLARRSQVRARMLLAFTLIALAGAGRLAFQIGWDPEVRFFSARSPADWVTEAIPPDAVSHPAIEREVVFRKTFTLDAAPAQARLRARVYRVGDVQVNGQPTGLVFERDETWKRDRERDVAPLLRAGENEIVVRARASYGPAAIWLALDGPGLLVTSDASWTASAAGSAARPARLASTAMSAWGEPAWQPGSMLAALRASLPWLGAFALAAALVIRAARRLLEPRGTWLVAASALAIALLAWHNRGLNPGFGFDSGPHVDYMRFILEQHRLPLASDGWSMYHPPLYYLAGAAVHALFDGSVVALRAMNAVAVVVQCAALLGSLRILFPDRLRRVLAGFVLGAFVPMQLYLTQYVTNEVWTAALASAPLYLCLRILARDERAPGSRAWGR